MQMIDDWIIGFVDGDGSFLIQTSGSSIRNCFVVSQDKRSVNVLYALKSFFKCGNVHKAGNNMRQYKVTDKKQLKEIILPFFAKNCLQTRKWDDFKKVYDNIMDSPLTQPQKVSITRDWLTGFTDAEGCFYVSMVKRNSLPYPRPQFTIGLHMNDQQVLNEIQRFLGCGILYTKTSKKGSQRVFQISRMSGFEKIITILTTNKNRCLLKTSKKISFLKFRKIIRLIKIKEHLTQSGNEKIQKIIGRKF